MLKKFVEKFKQNTTTIKNPIPRKNYTVVKQLKWRQDIIGIGHSI